MGARLGILADSRRSRRSGIEIQPESLKIRGESSEEQMYPHDRINGNDFRGNTKEEACSSGKSLKMLAKGRKGLEGY